MKMVCGFYNSQKSSLESAFGLLTEKGFQSQTREPEKVGEME